MKPKLLIVYLLLVSLPLVILGWLGARAVSQERAAVDEQILELLNEQLRSYDRDISTMLLAWGQDWERMDWTVYKPDGIRSNLRRDGRITQFFCADSQGNLMFPRMDERNT